VKGLFAPTVLFYYKHLLFQQGKCQIAFKPQEILHLTPLRGHFISSQYRFRQVTTPNLAHFVIKNKRTKYEGGARV